jgi:hypothetical protein
MQIRRFAAVSSQSGPRFCEECSEAIDRTPFGRCNRGEFGSRENSFGWRTEARRNLAESGEPDQQELDTLWEDI